MPTVSTMPTIRTTLDRACWSLTIDYHTCHVFLHCKTTLPLNAIFVCLKYSFSFYLSGSDLDILLPSDHLVHTWSKQILLVEYFLQLNPYNAVYMRTSYIVWENQIYASSNMVSVVPGVFLLLAAPPLEWESKSSRLPWDLWEVPIPPILSPPRSNDSLLLRLSFKLSISPNPLPPPPPPIPPPIDPPPVIPVLMLLSMLCWLAICLTRFCCWANFCWLDITMLVRADIWLTNISVEGPVSTKITTSNNSQISQTDSIPV